MITVDKEGNVWTTDVALHVATKWSPSGTKLLELGERSVPGHDKEHLCKPTQVIQTALCRVPRRRDWSARTALTGLEQMLI